MEMGISIGLAVGLSWSSPASSIKWIEKNCAVACEPWLDRAFDDRLAILVDTNVDLVELEIAPCSLAAAKHRSCSDPLCDGALYIADVV